MPSPEDIEHVHDRRFHFRRRFRRGLGSLQRKWRRGDDCREFLGDIEICRPTAVPEGDERLSPFFFRFESVVGLELRIDEFLAAQAAAEDRLLPIKARSLQFGGGDVLRGLRRRDSNAASRWR